MKLPRVPLAAVAVLLFMTPAFAASARIAVAANFTAVAETLAEQFKQKTGDEVMLSFGASGALYTQIAQGAPFDVFLSADQARPEKAVEEGLAVEGTTFTYAEGRLVLYSGSDIVPGEEALEAGQFNKLAIANPEAAPYGAAAVETLKALELYGDVEGKLVTGESIAQALQFVDTGNAELGFVAQSQVVGKPTAQIWVVPSALYSPIRQDAVLLKTGEANPVALAFLDFLKSSDAIAIIEAAGYTVQ